MSAWSHRYPSRRVLADDGRAIVRRRRKHRDDSAALRLDDEFIQGAVVVELSAAQRAAQQRRERLRQEMGESSRQEARRQRRARRHQWRRRALALLGGVVIASLVGRQLLNGGLTLSSSPPLPVLADPGPQRLVSDGKVIDRPPPPKEQSAVPLGRPAPLAHASDDYRFMFVRPGTNRPVTYDPCRPIHVVVNMRTATGKADVLLDEALEAVGRATGLAFIRDGPTNEPPTATRAPYQPDRYPNRWAPVLVAWSDPTESPALADSVAGTGGSLAFFVGDDRTYVTGGVTLDGPQFGEIMKRRDGHEVARALIMHELGHLVGLDHVPYPTEIMSPGAGRVSFGNGDLAGLALLGQGDCFPFI